MFKQLANIYYLFALKPKPWPQSIRVNIYVYILYIICLCYTLDGVNWHYPMTSYELNQSYTTFWWHLFLFNSATFLWHLTHWQLILQHVFMTSYSIPQYILRLHLTVFMYGRRKLSRFSSYGAPLSRADPLLLVWLDLGAWRWLSGHALRSSLWWTRCWRWRHGSMRWIN